MVLVALMALLEVAASAGNRFLSRVEPGLEIYPSTSPFKSMHVSLKMIGPQPERPAIVRLMDAAHRLASRTNVPYVFGGRQLGSPNQCQQCSECIREHKLAANSTLIRYNRCSACRNCGIDCSNFVNRLFAEAGLRYQFADTRTLNRMKEDTIQEAYGFVNLGRDLSQVRPGDLILEKSHIVLVVDVDHALGTIDYIHASRGSKRTPVGGIELRRGSKLEKLGPQVVKILRHQELLVPEDSGIVLGSVKSVWSDMKRLLASNR